MTQQVGPVRPTTAPADHQLVPRDHLGRGQVRYLVTEPARAEVTAAGRTIDCPVTEAGGVLDVSLPTGGPYDIRISSGATTTLTRGLLVGDLWVLAGQSNMSGGGLSPLTSEDPRISLLSADGRWQVAREPLHRLFESETSAPFQLYPDVNPAVTAEQALEQLRSAQSLEQGGAVGGVGPGWAFANELVALTGVPIGLVPVALGATPLAMWHPQWRSPRGVAANLYRYLVEQVGLAGRPAGLVWYQGESDTTPELAPTYRERVSDFLTGFRSDVGEPALPVVCVQLGRSETWPDVLAPYWAQVRDAQRQVAQLLDNVRLVAAADLELQDGLHLSTPGQQKLGVRIARAATAFARGAATSYGTPMLAAARAEGTSVRLSFDGLNGGLDRDADLGGLFRCDVPVERATISGTAEVELACSGSPSWVGYCLGLTDQTVLHDQEGFPVPAFGPVQL